MSISAACEEMYMHVGTGGADSATSVDQYAGMLACWLGLSDGQIKMVFANFGTFGPEPFIG